MIKIPNYDVVVPVVPDLRLFGRQRLTNEGDRNPLVYEFTAEETTIITLPWTPTASEWVEIYIDGIRLINPRITSDLGGSLFEVFNVTDLNILRFNIPVSGNLKIICDTQAAHWWGSVIIDPKNVQSFFQYKDVYNFQFDKWPITSGTITGFRYRVFYEPGPSFAANSYVIIRDCEPTNFNGNFLVINSTPEEVVFRGNIPAATGTTMTVPGKISGFGNGIVKESKGIGLYSEPVIITQPYHGYARLTTDRQGIAYVPDLNYVGNDTFSWALINQHGQIGTPRCVNIRVRRAI